MAVGAGESGILEKVLITGWDLAIPTSSSRSSDNFLASDYGI
jgi:hypothetical protein